MLLRIPFARNGVKKNIGPKNKKILSYIQNKWKIRKITYHKLDNYFFLSSHSQKKTLPICEY